MKPYRILGIILLFPILIGCGKIGTYSISIQYQPQREFPSLKEKIGTTLGIAPIQDERKDKLYIGTHTSLREVNSYFKSHPFPLEKAISNSISKVLSDLGIRTVSLKKWEGTPESLKDLETDSALRIEINKFWTEGRAAPFRTTMRTSIHLILQLGVKKEGKVFTRNVEIEKEVTLSRLTPAKVEEMVNQILTDIFDSFLSNPY
ncbi:MAG: hypothetical protein ACUVTN_09145 [Thermodesulfobacteriota bacterium]